MPEESAFKHKINHSVVQKLADETKVAMPAFDAKGFVAAAEKGLEDKALKARVDHVARCWRQFLPTAYEEALRVVLRTLGPKHEKESGWGDTVFVTWIHAHFVQVFGLGHPDLSLSAMVEITQRGTAEFAVRPYLTAYPAETLAFLKTQLCHRSPHVRRWVSEGTRPRLPWGERLAAFVADPSENLVLLRALRGDPSSYVRTSVANHLGDIAKDHPDLAVEEIARWMEEGVPYAGWYAKTGLRHLIKKGHRGALEVLGFSASTKASLHILELDRSEVQIGQSFTFSFALIGSRNEKLSIDYAIDFASEGGRPKRKIFKLAVRRIEKGERIELSKKHAMRKVTTRTLHPGRHRLAVLVNGVELGNQVFELVE